MGRRGGGWLGLREECFEKLSGCLCFALGLLLGFSSCLSVFDTFSYFLLISVHGFFFVKTRHMENESEYVRKKNKKKYS